MGYENTLYPLYFTEEETPCQRGNWNELEKGQPDDSYEPPGCFSFSYKEREVIYALLAAFLPARRPKVTLRPAAAPASRLG